MSAKVKTDIDIKKTSMPKLAEAYNAAIGELGKAAGTRKPIKKFSDRKSAERRVAEVFDELDALRANKKAPKTEEEISEARSAGITKSWDDPEVARKRSERHGVQVTVDGKKQYYGSVRKAFVALGLALSGHIAFRMHLKEQGTVKENGRTWKVVPLQKAEKS